MALVHWQRAIGGEEWLGRAWCYAVSQASSCGALEWCSSVACRRFDEREASCQVRKLRAWMCCWCSAHGSSLFSRPSRAPYCIVVVPVLLHTPVQPNKRGPHTTRAALQPPPCRGFCPLGGRNVLRVLKSAARRREGSAASDRRWCAACVGCSAHCLLGQSVRMETAKDCFGCSRVPHSIGGRGGGLRQLGRAWQQQRSSLGAWRKGRVVVEWEWEWEWES